MKYLMKFENPKLYSNSQLEIIMVRIPIRSLADIGVTLEQLICHQLPMNDSLTLMTPDRSGSLSPPSERMPTLHRAKKLKKPLISDSTMKEEKPTARKETLRKHRKMTQKTRDNNEQAVHLPAGRR